MATYKLKQSKFNIITSDWHPFYDKTFFKSHSYEYLFPELLPKSRMYIYSHIMDVYFISTIIKMYHIRCV